MHDLEYTIILLNMLTRDEIDEMNLEANSHLLVMWVILFGLKEDEITVTWAWFCKFCSKYGTDRLCDFVYMKLEHVENEDDWLTLEHIDRQHVSSFFGINSKCDAASRDRALHAWFDICKCRYDVLTLQTQKDLVWHMQLAIVAISGPKNTGGMCKWRAAVKQPPLLFF